MHGGYVNIFIAKDNEQDTDIEEKYTEEVQLLYTEILLRKGKITISNLSENVIKVMNRVTKSFPVNLLARDFIQYKEKNENI